MPDTTSTHLPEPYEFLDLEHGLSVSLAISRSEMGTALIHPTAITPRQIRLYMMQNGLSEPPPAGTPISVAIPVMRVYGVRLDEASPLSYWDISSKTLQANLWPRLLANRGGILTVTITANGYRPTKRYSVGQGG
jgi:hypothetical protein